MYPCYRIATENQEVYSNFITCHHMSLFILISPRFSAEQSYLSNLTPHYRYSYGIYIYQYVIQGLWQVLTKCTVYPKKYAHGFVVLCFVVVMQSFIMNPHEVFIHIHQGCFAGTGAIVRLPQCQWSKTDGYGKISQCITTTKHSKAKTVCIFLGIYCTVNGMAYPGNT